MSTLTLVHATSARLHGQLLGGSHIRRSKKKGTARRGGVAALQAETSFTAQKRLKRGAWSEGQGRTEAVKRSRTNSEGVRSSMKLLGKLRWGM